MRNSRPKEKDPRYKLAFSLLAPLPGHFVKPQAGDSDPFSWGRWGQYRPDDPESGKKLPRDARQFFGSGQKEGWNLKPDLTKRPKSQPWLRLPGAYYGEGSQITEVFLKHVENLLYPGMALLRKSVGGEAVPLTDPSWHPPSARWIGLPRSTETLVVDLSNTIKPRSSFRGELELSVDAAEVFGLALGPDQEQFGQVVMGILHFSLGADGFRSSFSEASTDLGGSWGLLLLKDLLFNVSQHMVALRPKKEWVSSKNVLRRKVNGSESAANEAVMVVGSPLEPFFRSRSWLTSTYFQGFDHSKEALGRSDTMPGGHFVVHTSPSTLFDNEGDINADKASKMTLDQVDRRLIQQASLARDEEEAQVCALTGRVRAASTWRGTSLLNKGSESRDTGGSPSALASVSDQAFWSLDSADIRNFRSYWLQGVLVGTLQHQLLKRFSNRLGISGADIRNIKVLNRQYEQWLLFGNAVWWTELTYDRPMTDRLLSNYREALKLQQTYGELRDDFQTYTAFAEREHEKETAKILNVLQVLGAGVVVFSLGAAASDILQGEKLGGIGLAYWIVAAIGVTLLIGAAVFRPKVRS